MWVELVIVLICLGLNAVLSLIEMAFVSVSKPEIRQLVKTGHHSAVKLFRLRENPERTLSVLQIGITVVGAISAAVGGSGAKETLVPALLQYNLSESTADIISIVVVVLPLTILNVIIGELVPKSIALRNPMRISLASATGLAIAEKFLNPFVRVLEISTLLFLKAFFPRLKKTLPTSEDGNSVNISNLSGTHQQFVVNLVHIELKQMKDIMVSWEKVNYIRESDSLNQVLSLVIKSGHTRLPILSIENQVTGLLHSKEFLTFVSTGDENWRSIVRPMITAHANDPILRILRVMQEKKSHMAIIRQGEENLGIVTLEDIIEEIVGDISDEDEDGQLRRLLSTRVLQRSDQKK